MEFKRGQGESNEEFIFRVCSEKKNIGTWDDVKEIINDELGLDFTESRYRKQYKRFSDKNKDAEAELSELDCLRLEKAKIRDERTALNKKYRDSARIEELFELLSDAIPKYNDSLHINFDNVNKEKALFVCVSDVHYGETNKNYFGETNSDITKKRFEKYLSEIIRIQKNVKADKCYVSLMGDLISGNIHNTIRITNKENVVEQIMGCSTLISSFIFELSKYFNYIEVNSVAGNHTRLSKKEDSLRDERLDDFIYFYLKAALQNVSNVSFRDEQKIDPSISYINVLDKEYLMVHGDFDAFNETGVGKLVMMCGFKPTGVFFGHKHKCSYDECSGISLIRSGSFSDGSGDFCVSSRISGIASQMVCVLTKDGVESFYPIKL